MGELDRFKLGQLVQLGDGRVGIIKWIGSGDFAEGEFLGLELNDDSGKNNGEVKGVRYFECPDNRGLMARPGAVDAILQQPPAQKAAPATASKRTSIIGAASNGARATAPAAKRLSTVPAPAARRQTLIDPTSKRQSINAASPTPASRGVSSKVTASPTKTATGRPMSISGAPKPLPGAVRPAVTSTAAKRTSLAPRPAPGAAAAPAARPARTTSTASNTGSSRALAATSAVKRPANRLSTLQQPTSRRTASISSRTEISDQGSVGQGGDDEQKSGDHGTDGTNDASSKSASNAGRTMLSPPNSAREPSTPHLSRPTTQQLSAQNRKIDDLETKLRVLEKQKAEDRERLKDLDRISGERSKLEGILQKLQAKIQPQSQELAQLRKDFKDMEDRASAAEAASANVDEIVEEATLDREMAEELAEGYKSELDALRKSHEEIKLEVEILRAENEDLGREMSPEERDSMGFAQLEKSNERLREALIKLRDITQDTEAELRDQIKELQEETQELGTLKAKFEEVQEQLEHSESLAEELKQQLETAQGGEEMIEELSEKNMALAEQVEQLRVAVDELESLREINDELELNHVEHEKSMQEDIDYRDALLFEQARKMSEQDELVEELEYTVSRFRELVANLNSDLEEMRNSQQITEAEANELSSKTKAMLDVNMRLQQSAAKTQIKVIDTELRRLEAQEASDHLAIVQMFLPDSYAHHRDSVTTFLRFKRISFKASMLYGFIKERVNGVAVQGHEEDMFAACDVLNRLTWISAMCNRFVKFIVACPTDVFGQIGNASYDLDPVERMFNNFVESLKREELKDQQCAADLQRTMSVLEHLGERYLGEGLADFAESVYMRALVMQSQLDTSASAIVHIKMIAQARVVLPSDADENDEEEAQAFVSKAESVVSSLRSARTIAGKAIRELEELQSRNLTLEPSTQASIESTETAVANLSSICRASGLSVAKLVNEDARFDSLTHEQIMHAISASDATPFSSLASSVNSIITAVQSFSALTTTISQTVEFSSPQTDSLSAVSTPWAQLAARLREETSASAGHEAEIARLHDQLNERSTALALKDKTLSELHVSVEVLEKRASDATKATSRARELEQQLHQAERKSRELDTRLQQAVENGRSIRAERDQLLASGVTKPGNKGAGDAEQGPRAHVQSDFVSAKAMAEIAALKSELETTQSVVRQLRAAMNEANLSATQADGVLESLTREPALKPEELEASIREKSAKDACKALRSLVGRDSSSFVKLQNVNREERLKWRPVKETVAWQVDRRREEWDNWKGWVTDVARDEKSASKRCTMMQQVRQERRQQQTSSSVDRGSRDVLAKLTLTGLSKTDASKPFNGHITILDSSEWDGLGRRLGLSY